MSDIPQRLHLLPLQIIPVDDGVVLRRGAARLHLVGDGAGEVIERLAALTGQGADLADILADFPDTARETVEALLDQLRERRFLAAVDDPGAPPADEDRLDVFYWSFGAERAEVERDLASRSICVVGVNAVGLALTEALVELGVGRVSLVDHPLLRNVDYFSDTGAFAAPDWRGPRPIAYGDWADIAAMPDCLTVASDFGGPSLMREWNAFCVSEKITFMPVVLHDFVGYAGPIVTPGTTACFECYWLRQNSNLEKPRVTRAAENAAFQGQIVDGLAPLTASVLARIAAFELYKFFARRIPSWRADRVLELDLLDGSMKPRKFLRAPRCPVCGPGMRHGAVSIEAVAEMPGNPMEG